MRALILFTGLILACSTDPKPTDATDAGLDAGLGGLNVTDVALNLVVPGSVAQVTGAGFLEDASYYATLSVGSRDLGLTAAFEAQDRLTVRFPGSVVAGLPEGAVQGTLKLTMATPQGSATTARPLNFELRHTLTPSLTTLASGLFPASPVALLGDGFLYESEGQSRLTLTGTLVEDATGRAREVALEVVAEPTDLTREEARFVLSPEDFGIEPGHFEGVAQITNEGEGWTAASASLAVEADLLPPSVDALDAEGSRGQAIRIGGQGFVGGPFGGLTVLKVDGQFEALGARTPISDLELTPDWVSGGELIFVMRARYTADCQSTDLGAIPGVLSGQITPEIEWGGRRVVGSPSPITFKVLPTKQVVWLRFLPAFTDALRLFGLRNYSREVQARVVEVIRRDYAGINVEIRLSEPTDFIDYSVVEVGGADPNGQSLFGLDNTPGLDHCNARLDDNLAGLNADSAGEGSYGGVFVESFLALSPSLSDGANPLSDQVFDDIFEEVIASPAEPGELTGPRGPAITLAIRTLGNLVGNTISHEVGHSLGLTVVPGCGQYHNPPGDFQMMDCGRDRPFLERAELVPGQEGRPAVWVEGDRAYLEQILPLD